VSTMFEARGGNAQFNFTEIYRCLLGLNQVYKGCSENEDPNASLADQAQWSAYLLGSDAGWQQKSDFMKWRELSVRLDAPQSLANAVPFTSGLSVTLAARNLATFTSYPGIDPEINETGGNTQFSQNEFLTQPAPRIFTMRLDLSF